LSRVADIKCIFFTIFLESGNHKHRYKLTVVLRAFSLGAKKSNSGNQTTSSSRISRQHLPHFFPLRSSPPVLLISRPHRAQTYIDQLIQLASFRNTSRSLRQCGQGIVTSNVLELRGVSSVAFMSTPPLSGTPSVQLHHSCKHSLPRAESKLSLRMYHRGCYPR